MSKKEDIKFLYAYLEKLQKLLIVVEFSSENNCDWDPDALPRTDPEAERVACLADDVKIDGSIFRNLIPCPEYDFNEMRALSIRRLHKQIRTIPRIIHRMKDIERYKTEQGDAKKSRGKRKARKRGRPRIYTDDLLERMTKAYDHHYGEINSSKGAWNKVAELFGAKSGDAVRVACMNYQKKKLKTST
jgi:hypothetical protein